MKELIERTVNNIDALIKEELPFTKYQFELYDLISNTRHFRGYEELFHWGSVYKLFVVANIIKMSEDGLFEMNDEMDLHKELYVNGNGIVKYLTHLDKLTYTDACKMVMTVSDNLCADELLKIVGFDRLNNLFIQSGCFNSRLLLNLDTVVKYLFSGIPKDVSVKYFHSDAYFSELNLKLNELLKDNYTTVIDINTCFNFILNKYLSENGSSLLKEFILIPNVHSRIAACTYFGNFLLRGKTGALGFGIVNEETAAIINKSDNKVYGYFTVATKGNIKRNFISNDVISMIGLQIVELYEQLLIEIN